MKSINETIANYVASGMTINQAESYTCQEIILNKISKSKLANNILLKGGVVMFNLTHNLRRTTSDLDFDFIRYDISSESIKKFVELLNKYDSNYKLVIKKITQLHQEDYKGKRVFVELSDKTGKIKIKLDIGVHTLLAIKQETACFSFNDGCQIMLQVNPPEQIFAEKAYSLAKHGALSTRFKDVFDMYYFINQGLLNDLIVKKCIDLLLVNKTNNLRTITDVCENISTTFEDDQYVAKFKESIDNWLDVDYKIVFASILDYIYSI